MAWGWILHLSGAKGELARQLVGGPEGDGEAVRDLFNGSGNPLRLAAYSAASHLPRPAGRWRMDVRRMEKPEAILFDAGGTLVLQDPVELSRLLRIPVDPPLAFEAHYRAMDAYARLRLAGEEMSWVWWQSHYFAGLGLIDPDTGAALTGNGYGLWSAAIDGTVEAISRIRRAGIRVAVVSNSDGSVRESLSRAGFDGLFEFVVDSHEVGVAKPDPAIFVHALERLGLGPAAAWYVGDSIFHDVGGGIAAGLAASVLVDPFDLALDHSPRIASVTQLPGLLGLAS